jgi:hypothetical protein
MLDPSTPVAPVAPTLVAFLVTLAVLVVSVLHPSGRALDRRLFTAINSRHLPAPLEWVTRLVSHLGLMPTQSILWLALAAYQPSLTTLLGIAGLVASWLLCRGIKRRVR